MKQFDESVSVLSDSSIASFLGEAVNANGNDKDILQ
jgi:hypothetical protein